MKCHVIAIGHKMPDWVDSGYQEYAKRMPREMPVSLLEIKPEKRTSGKTTEQLLHAEYLRIRAALPVDCRTIVLDERGDLWTSEKLAITLQQWAFDTAPIAFIIGSADGLHAEIKNNADAMLALSRLTLPHGLVRVLLAEQLYRASTIIKGHPYHRS